MRIQFSKEKALALRAALEKWEDAQATGQDEYVADFYDTQPPVSLELAFDEEGVQVLAAGLLAYSQEMDGWYLADPVEDAAMLEKILNTLL